MWVSEILRVVSVVYCSVVWCGVVWCGVTTTTTTTITITITITHITTTTTTTTTTNTTTTGKTAMAEAESKVFELLDPIKAKEEEIGKIKKRLDTLGLEIIKLDSDRNDYMKKYKKLMAVVERESKSSFIVKFSVT